MKDSNVGKGIKKIVIGQYFSIVATSLLGITSILLNVFKINADLLKSNFYGILLAASIVIVIGSLLFFKRKKWI